MLTRQLHTESSLTTNFILFGYFQVLDVLTTIVCLLHGVHEANPVVKFALLSAPTPLMGFVIVKCVAMALAAFCWKFGRENFLGRVNFFFAVLVSWNLLALISSAA